VRWLSSRTTQFGIIAGRLYPRRIALEGKVSAKVKVRDITETAFPIVDQKNSVDECIAIMTAESVRYLPVMDNGKLSGLVSMDDLVNAKVDDQKFQIDELVKYFRGTRWYVPC
jgi:CBS domain-containing protein